MFYWEKHFRKSNTWSVFCQDENKFNNLSKIYSAYYTVENVTVKLNKFAEEYFSILHLTLRGLKQNFKQILKNLL